MNTKKLVHSFGYAFEGLRLAVTLDQNVRFHLLVGTLVLLISVFLRITKIEMLFVVFAIFFVLITEMMNTAIEEMTNLIIKEHRMEAKIAKDVAAASVLLSALFAIVIGIAVFLPYVIKLF